jgi:phosphoserine aminotransferase
MKRVYNFSAGPAALPEAVLNRIQNELINHHGSGMSVMEMSHRSHEFEAILKRAEDDLRYVLAIPNHYEVLFLQGGASLQFSMIPLNLCVNRHVSFIHTGEWSQKALEEAEKLAEVDLIASGKADQFRKLPDLSQVHIQAKTDYVYYVSNNTIYCTQFKPLPKIDHHLVVCDMSSDLLSRPVQIEDFGLIFAGAQKNMGIAGLTIVIIRKDLLERSHSSLSNMLNYQTLAKHRSLYNTPPVFNIYVAGLVFEWVKEEGGLAAIQQENLAKAQRLYAYIDHSQLFNNDVNPADRSTMNVSFRSASATMDEAFIEFSKAHRIANIKGHRLVGGMRASLYNAMSMEGVEQLISCMKAFEEQELGQ